jgi:hypothetical protein
MSEIGKFFRWIWTGNPNAPGEMIDKSPNSPSGRQTDIVGDILDDLAADSAARLRQGQMLDARADAIEETKNLEEDTEEMVQELGSIDSTPDDPSD